MAFNPFTSFRKYQKFWMATILLVCMITFVLCTGVGGDLSDRILRWFGGRGGSPLGKLNGRTVNSTELQDVKTLREVASRFMRKSCEVAIHSLDEVIKANKDKRETKQQQQLYGLALAIRAELDRKHQKPRYFEGGTKLEDLFDFMMWQAVADKLGIQLVDEVVGELYNSELLNRFE